MSSIVGKQCRQLWFPVDLVNCVDTRLTNVHFSHYVRYRI